MFTDSWSPVGSQTEMNLDKDKILLLNYAVNRWIEHENITIFKVNGDNKSSSTYKSISNASMQDGNLMAAPFEIGNWDTSRGDMVFKGRIKEIIVLDKTTNAFDNILINDYLSKKWNLTSTCLLYTSPSPRD